jgi:hypothetical protein
VRDGDQPPGPASRMLRPYGPAPPFAEPAVPHESLPAH